MTSSIDKLKAIARDVHSGKCPECRWFMEDESFQRFGWFGLRKNVSTKNSVRFGACAAYGEWANIARAFSCKGREWEPKK